MPKPRKRRPATIYRVEVTDPESRLNSTSQYLNRPTWWPGPCVVERTVAGRPLRYVYIEGAVTWGDDA